MNGVQTKPASGIGGGMQAKKYSEISGGDRRITKYVMSQVRVWLAEKIAKKEYQPNKSREAKELLTVIRQNKAINEEQYSRFLSLFYNEPFEYIFKRKQMKSGSYITTDKVENYFMDYNGAVIPVGFIKDFFEDDYETQKEIEEYMAKYVKAEINRTRDNCEISTLKNSSQIEDLEEEYPTIFHTSPLFYISRFIRFAVLVFLTVLLVRFVVDTHVVDVLITGPINGETEYTYEIDEKYFIWGTWLHYYSSLHAHDGVPYFNLDGYMEALGISVAINVVLFIYLLVNYIRVIKAIIFHVKIMLIHRHIGKLKKNCNNNERVMEDMDAYAKEPDVLAAMCKRERCITDEICAQVPGSIKKFYKRTDNALVLGKIKEQIETLSLKNNTSFLHFFYDAHDEKKRKAAHRQWVGSFIKIIIWAIILFIINWPLTPLIELIHEVLPM